MKYLILWLLIAFTVVNIHSQTIDSVKAQKVALTFFSHIKMGENAVSLKLIPFESQQSAILGTKSNSNIYIFNNSGGGFIVISGNKQSLPILAYSETGNITSGNLPPALQEWISWKDQEIAYFNINNENQTGKYSSLWNQLESGNAESVSTAQNRAPLISTFWGQGMYYNDLCPVDSTSGYSNKRVPVGCVATAMTQVMKYWEYPQKGTGNHSYTHSAHGLLSADFASTTYSWDLMPINLNTVNTTLSTISYHCGVSVDMNYGPTGSGSNMYAAKNALFNYFKYKNTITLYYKNNVSNEFWLSKIKNEIDSLRPVLLAGSGTNGGGHAYVCDGYTNDNYFHINWGWDGSYNGYYYFDDLTPGLGDYRFYQSAIVGIQPSEKTTIVYPYTANLASLYGATGTFKVVSNSNWTISCDKTWLNFDTLSGYGNKIITYTANSANTTGYNRLATVTVTSPDLIPKTILITQLPQSASLPNLTAYKPGSWKDKLLVSIDYSMFSDTTLTTSDTALIHYAIANLGTENINDLFYCWLVVDSTVVLENYRTSLKSGYFSSRYNQILGKLNAGIHKVKLVIDPLNSISETNENDNVYEKNYTVSNNGKPYLYCTYNNYTFNFTGGKLEIPIASNINWKTESNESWILANAIFGKNDSTILLNVPANSGDSDREGVLLITGAGVDTINIKMSQLSHLPNLAVYKPSTWNDKINISNKTGTLADDTIFNTQNVYIDYSYINNGNYKTEGTFFTKVLLDNVVLRNTYRTDTLAPNYYTYYKDYALGTLTTGDHTIKIIVDETNTIKESNENDNTFTKTFTVYDAATSLSVNTNLITVKGEANDTSITLNCMGNWTISNLYPWFKTQVTSGNGNYTLKISFDENTGASQRNGNFNISNAVTSKTVSVKQISKNTGFQDLDTKLVHVYPNPCTDNICIEPGNKKLTGYKVYNQTGTLILQSYGLNKDSNISVKQLTAGYYILLLEFNNITYQTSFVKQ